MVDCPSLNTLSNCTVAVSYLRPDEANAIIPWVYSLILLLCHLPLVIIRVVRWETGQIWSLAMATFSVGLTCLAYGSSGLAPEQVLIWTPIALTVDVGAVMQVFILILEADGERVMEMLRGDIGERGVEGEEIQLQPEEGRQAEGPRFTQVTCPYNRLLIYLEPSRCPSPHGTPNFFRISSYLLGCSSVARLSLRREGIIT